MRVIHQDLGRFEVKVKVPGKVPRLLSSPVLGPRVGSRLQSLGTGGKQGGGT